MFNYAMYAWHQCLTVSVPELVPGVGIVVDVTPMEWSGVSRLPTQGLVPLELYHKTDKVPVKKNTVNSDI